MQCSLVWKWIEANEYTDGRTDATNKNYFQHNRNDWVRKYTWYLRTDLTWFCDTIRTRLNGKLEKVWMSKLQKKVCLWKRNYICSIVLVYSCILIVYLKDTLNWMFTSHLTWFRFPIITTPAHWCKVPSLLDVYPKSGWFWLWFSTLLSLKILTDRDKYCFLRWTLHVIIDSILNYSALCNLQFEYKHGKSLKTISIHFR